MKKKIIYFGALLTISLSGCSIINGSKSEELEEESFHEIAENSTYTSINQCHRKPIFKWLN
ncbi:MULTISPECIES: hypothetical protein [Dolosigranulum]|uniref:Lipoprotein n=1 Tax=Dolosigranulum savutiense TaxID=3110288 RepID=A0AB74TYQ4_9LACT|nr:hypothetical protein [Dolosigranulum pigrum]RAN65411.1 hypothetical protein B8A45_04305 [Dolosigranulum pigrum]